MSLGCLCLRQHFRKAKDGTSGIKKTYIKLSLNDNEVNHFICCRDPVDDADEEFVISQDNDEDSDCLAILRLSSVL